MPHDQKPTRLDKASGALALVLLFVLTIFGIGDPPRDLASNDVNLRMAATIIAVARSRL